jgi:hypothetical protein
MSLRMIGTIETQVDIIGLLDAKASLLDIPKYSGNNREVDKNGR